jgi:hypothetical protein
MDEPAKIQSQEARDFWKAVFIAVIGAPNEGFDDAVLAADSAVDELLARMPGYQPRPDVAAPVSGRRDL